MSFRESTNIQALWRCTVLLTLMLVPVAGQGGDEPQFQTDTNFFGMDIRDFDLPEENPRLCYDACVAEKHCHAFTYLRPHGWGGAGSTAHCWLKYGIPSDVRHEPCCVSGIVRPGEDPPSPPPPKPEPRPEPRPVPDPKPLRVTDIKLNVFPKHYNGPCPVPVQYQAVITASGPGTVYYRLWHEGDTMGPPAQLEFEAAGTKDVWATRDVWATHEGRTAGRQSDLREKLEIMELRPSVSRHCDPMACQPHWETTQSAEVGTILECYENPTSQQNPKQEERH